MLISDIFELMSEEFKSYENLSKYEKDQYIQWEFAKHKARQFSGRENLIDHYINMLNSGTNMFVIQGKSGYGKSTLMSKLALSLTEQGYDVLPLYVGLTSETRTAMDIVRYIVEFLEKNVSYKVDDFNCYDDAYKKAKKIKSFFDDHKIIHKFMCYICSPFVFFSKKLYRLICGLSFLGNIIKPFKEDVTNQVEQYTQYYESIDTVVPESNDLTIGSLIKRLQSIANLWNGQVNHRFIILIDAMDQLAANEARKRLNFVLPKLLGKIQIVISCTDSYELPNVHVETINLLNIDTRKKIVHGILKFGSREVDVPVMDTIVNKSTSGNPLYLSLLIHRLTMMDKSDFECIDSEGGKMHAINARQIQLVQSCAENLDGICVDIIKIASQHIGGDFVWLAIRYLAFSRYGLREADMEKLLLCKKVEWNSLDFTAFIRYLDSFFILRNDGRYDFSHRYIREGILRLMGDDKSAQREIFSHLKNLDKDDSIRQREILWHCFKNDDKDFFIKYIVENYSFDNPVIGWGQSVTTLIDLAKKECSNIFSRHDTRWFCDLIKYAMTEKFDEYTPALSSFFSSLFDDIVLFEYNFAHDKEDSVVSFCNYIRLHYRKYSLLLISAYYWLGQIYYNVEKENLRVARKYVNKGISLIKKLYSCEEIEHYVNETTYLNGMVVEGYSNIIQEIYILKSLIENIGVDIDMESHTSEELNTLRGTLANEIIHVKYKTDW